MIMYKLAFKKLRYLRWLSLIIHTKYSEVYSGYFKGMQDNKISSMVLVYDKSDESQKALELFKKNYEVYFQYFKGKLCNYVNKDCQKFLSNFQFQVSERPFLFTVNFNKKNNHPLIHFYKEDTLELQPFRQFVKDLRKNRIKYEVFS